MSGRTELVRGVGLVKWFGGIVANDAVDFVVAEGDLVGLIGPNGSGKTTLINVLTGHLEPDGGDVLVRGQRMSGRPPNVYAAMGVARTFQQTQLMPGASMRIPIPLAPPEARYAMFLINLGDAQGQQATEDFLEVPLDIAAQPTIGSAMPVGNNIRLTWPSIPGRVYHVQGTTDLRSSFFDVFTDDLQGNFGEDISVEVPMMGMQSYYRIVLVPE